MVAHRAPLEAYQLDELTKIGDQRTPPIDVRRTHTARGWQAPSAA